MGRIVVVGGTGLIGSKIVTKLSEQRIESVAASPKSGVNAVTAEGLVDALSAADVVVDASNTSSFDDKPAIEYFATSTMNLLGAERATGVGHHVALSVIATDRLQGGGYFRAKLAQEELIKAAGIPYSIVRAAPVYDFVEAIADAATEDATVRLPDALVQPTDASDLADLVVDIAMGQPLNGIVEVAGPERFTLDELISEVLSAKHNPREVVADAHTSYFGALLDESTLLPGDGAVITSTSLDDWIAHSLAG